MTAEHTQARQQLAGLILYSAGWTLCPLIAAAARHGWVYYWMVVPVFFLSTIGSRRLSGARLGLLDGDSSQPIITDLYKHDQLGEILAAAGAADTNVRLVQVALIGTPLIALTIYLMALIE